MTGALVGLGSVQQQRAAALGSAIGEGFDMSAQAVPSSYTGVTVNERAPPVRMGRSPERRRSVQERFQIEPCPWGSALYVTEHWTDKRR